MMNGHEHIRIGTIVQAEHEPAAREMVFDALPGDSLGLEWEP